MKAVPRVAIEASLDELRRDRTGCALVRVCEHALRRDPGRDVVSPVTLGVLDRLLVGFLEHPGTTAETRALVALTRVQLRAVVSNAAASPTSVRPVSATLALPKIASCSSVSPGGMPALIARGLRVLSTTATPDRISADTGDKHASTAPTIRDSVTGLPNQQALLQVLSIEADRARRFGQPLSLAVVSVQHLDAVIARFGQKAGPAVLRAYGDQVFRSFRSCDFAAHLADREFGVLFPHTPAEGGMRALAKARQLARQAFVQIDDRPIALPGFRGNPVAWCASESPDAFLARARAAR